jgi:hypothetical protein
MAIRYVPLIDRWCETKQNSAQKNMNIEQKRANAQLWSPSGVTPT